MAAGNPVVIRLPGVLVDLFPGAERRIEATASTVREAIDALERLHPGMRDRLCDSSPSIRRHINVFVDGEKLALDASLPANAEIFILTAISGG